MRIGLLLAACLIATSMVIVSQPAAAPSVPQPGHLLLSNGMMMGADGVCRGLLEMRYTPLPVDHAIAVQFEPGTDCAVIPAIGEDEGTALSAAAFQILNVARMTRSPATYSYHFYPTFWAPWGDCPFGVPGVPFTTDPQASPTAPEDWENDPPGPGCSYGIHHTWTFENADWLTLYGSIGNSGSMVTASCAYNAHENWQAFGSVICRAVGAGSGDVPIETDVLLDQLPSGASIDIPLRAP